MDIEPQRPIPADQRMSITLTAAQWDLVLRALHEVAMPYRLSAPLIQEIHTKCLGADADER